MHSGPSNRDTLYYENQKVQQVAKVDIPRQLGRHFADGICSAYVQSHHFDFDLKCKSDRNRLQICP